MNGSIGAQLCAGCGCALPVGTPALGTKAPDGTPVVLCLHPCGARAMADDIFARQCAFAAMSGSTRAHVESLFKKAGLALPTNETAVRSIFGVTAPTFASVLAEVNARARAR